MDRYSSLKMFLQESITNYKNINKTNFAILHAITAVELALKEKLNEIDPTLLFRKKSKTIELSQLPGKLNKMGIHLSKDDKKTITDLANWRNDIVHNMPTHDINIAIKKLGKLYNFIFSFLSDQLNKDIKNILSISQITNMKRIILKADALVTQAKKNASLHSGEEFSYACNECKETQVIGIKDEKIFCFLCDEIRFEAFCNNCEKPLYFYSVIHSSDFICKDCIEEAGDLYMQMQIDLARGK